MIGSLCADWPLRKRGVLQGCTLPSSPSDGFWRVRGDGAL